jgi:hypothetical protein
MKMVRQSDLRTDRLYPTGNIPGVQILLEAKSTPRAIARPERIRNLPAYSTVPQPTALPRDHIFHGDYQNKRGSLRPGQERICVFCSNHPERFRLFSTFNIGYCSSCIFHDCVSQSLNAIAYLPSYAPR